MLPTKVPVFPLVLFIISVIFLSKLYGRPGQVIIATARPDKVINAGCDVSAEIRIACVGYVHQ